VKVLLNIDSKSQFFGLKHRKRLSQLTRATRGVQEVYCHVFKKEDNMKTETKVAIFALVITLGAGYISYLSWKDSTRLTENSIYLSIINTRIQTCTNLSNYHKGSGIDLPVITDQGKKVSTATDRGIKEANLARALTLCLVNVEKIDEIKTCVGKANINPSHKVHDEVGDKDSNSIPKGIDILAC
jgi:hypothetical protein